MKSIIFLFLFLIFFSNATYAQDIFGKKYFQLSYGYLTSNYSQFDSSLKNGSIISSLRFMVDVNKELQFGVGIETIQNKNSDAFLEDLTALQYQLCWDWVKPFKNSTWAGIYGFMIGLGDYSIRKKVILNGIEYKETLDSGSLVGVIPNFGVRYYFSTSTSLDLLGAYDGYIGPRQKYLGGFSSSLRLSGLY